MLRLCNGSLPTIDHVLHSRILSSYRRRGQLEETILGAHSALLPGVSPVPRLNEACRLMLLQICVLLSLGREICVWMCVWGCFCSTKHIRIRNTCIYCQEEDLWVDLCSPCWHDLTGTLRVIHWLILVRSCCWVTFCGSLSLDAFDTPTFTSSCWLNLPYP